MKKKKLITVILSIVTLFSLVACDDMPYKKQEMHDENNVWVCSYLLNSTTECMVGDWEYEYKETHKYLDYVFFPSHINNVKVVKIFNEIPRTTCFGICRGVKFFLRY